MAAKAEKITEHTNEYDNQDILDSLKVESNKYFSANFTPSIDRIAIETISDKVKMTNLGIMLFVIFSKETGEAILYDDRILAYEEDKTAEMVARYLGSIHQGGFHYAQMCTFYIENNELKYMPVFWVYSE